MTEQEIETLSYNIAYVILIFAAIGFITVIVIMVKILKKFFNIIFKSESNNNYYNKWNDYDRIIFRTKAKIPMPLSQYKPNQIYYDQFFKNPYNDINTKNMMIDILRHIKYEGPIPNIKYTLLGNEVSKHFIRDKEISAYIQITSEPKLPPIDLLALIIHECMYIYKDYYNIEYSQGFRQDTIADVLAIYLGFYNNLSVANKFYSSQNELDYIFKNI